MNKPYAIFVNARWWNPMDWFTKRVMIMDVQPNEELLGLKLAYAAEIPTKITNLYYVKTEVDAQTYFMAEYRVSRRNLAPFIENVAEKMAQYAALNGYPKYDEVWDELTDRLGLKADDAVEV